MLNGGNVMRVIDYVRQILDDSIAEPLAEVGIQLTDDRTGYTVARYEGAKTDFIREVCVLRDKWMSKNKGHFVVALSVKRDCLDETDLKEVYRNTAQSSLADLMDQPKHYWRIWITDDAAPFVEEFNRGMREHGIPWLERLSEPDNFMKWQEEYGC